MANRLYGKGRNKFARGEIHWHSAGDTFRAILIDMDQYTVQIDGDEFLSDIPALARMATIQLNLLDPAFGVCDALDTTFAAVFGPLCQVVVIYKDSGAEGTSPLIAYLDTLLGFPIQPNGGDILVRWDNDVSKKIFKL